MMTRLIRSHTDRMIGGVAGGVGWYFGLDPVIVRLLFVVLAFTGGIGFFLYLVLWVIMPEERQLPPDARFDPQTGQPLPPAMQSVRFDDPAQPLAPRQRNQSLALILVFVGGMVLLSNLGSWLGVEVSDVVLPVALIGFGVYLLRGRRDG